MDIQLFSDTIVINHISYPKSIILYNFYNRWYYSKFIKKHIKKFVNFYIEANLSIIKHYSCYLITEHTETIFFIWNLKIFNTKKSQFFFLI